MGEWGDAGIDPAANTGFMAARNWAPRRDPLAIDLDGDGIETVGIQAGVLFDFDGDGIKTGTGWLKGDDGWLVLDRNHNGIIDNGSELFGVDTVLANGQKATDGFAALRQLDSNNDGVFDARDAMFGEVRVWQDANQDGISQAGELKSLTALGIASIDLNAKTATRNLGNGNVQTLTADAAGGGTVANLDLAQNPFYSEFTDHIALSAAAAALPEMAGSGTVRDLQEAATISPDLAGTVAELSGITTRSAFWDQLDNVLQQWADTSDFNTSVEQGFEYGIKKSDGSRKPVHIWYLLPGQSLVFEGLNTYVSVGPPGFIDLKMLALAEERKELERRIGILEKFNGIRFLDFGDEAITTGSGQVVVPGGGFDGEAATACSTAPCFLACA